VTVVVSGPELVRAACDTALGDLARASDTSAVAGSREEWAGVIGCLQQVINAASAAQDAAMARLAAIEPEWLEDGTLVESHRGLGHVALDAPAIVSGVLACSAIHAERRVRTAVRLAGDGPAGSATETGLVGLHTAMARGRLDAYRASVIAEELEHAPAEVRATVITALDAHFDRDDGTHLRRRCRQVLTRISPDLLHQRAARARAESRLRRWADEPGVDHWDGTFPSEEAAQAWAAIDALARQYVDDGVCATIDRARAKALTDLVAGNASITTVLTVTVPATAVTDLPAGTAAEAAAGPAQPPAPSRPRGVEAPVAEGELVQVTGPAAGEPVLVSRQWLAETMTTTTALVAPCHPVTGALLDHLPARNRTTDHAAGGPGAYTPPKVMAARIRARDRRCRFPGCTIAAVFSDLDHVRPWPTGPTHDSNLLTLCRRHHRVKQRPGWAITLAPDGIATFTDPTGRVRSSHPVDALAGVTLTGPARTTPPPGPGRARTVVPDGPHTWLEFHLEHVAAPPPGQRPAQPPTWRDDHGTIHRVELLPITAIITVDHDTWPGRHARHRSHRRAHDDLPPF
jgi:hypothetical protein